MATTDKILSWEAAQQQRVAWQQGKETVVFTNGCFDLLHPGHTTYLEGAKAEGDRLIIGLNSDSSVRGLKGESRPILPETARAQLLAALEVVDAVVIFPEQTPAALISLLKPDVLAKGADYQVHEIVGADTVMAYGGKVARIPLVDGFSTSKIVEKIRKEG